MKRFLIDRLLFLMAGIIIMVLIPYVWKHDFMWPFEILVALSWGYLCRRILLLPLDLFFGKITQSAYFSCPCGNEYLEFISGSYCYIWKFYYGDNKTLKLLIPSIVSRNTEDKPIFPQKDRKLAITYFRFSKVLLSWTSN